MVESRTMLFEDSVEEGEERCFPAWMRRRDEGAREVRTERRVVRCWTERVGETSREIVSPLIFFTNMGIMGEAGSGDVDREEEGDCGTGVEESILNERDVMLGK
jgi:hypothetical protein